MDEVGRKLLAASLHDEAAIRSLVRANSEALPGVGLDARTETMVQFGALVCLDAPTVSYQMVVERALAVGVEAEDLVTLLGALAPLVGEARTVAAASCLAAALGYDLDAALETPYSLDAQMPPATGPDPRAKW